MKSKIYSNSYVKTTSKGQLWLPVVIAISFFMAFCVAELVMLDQWTNLNYDASQLELLYENLWKDGLVKTGFYVTLAAAFLSGVNSFWYLYSSRKVDFYHSLPVKRSKMFWHRAYVNLLYYIVPYLVMEFFAVCIGAMRGLFNLRLMEMACCMFLIHLIFYLLFYFSTVLVISMTGNMLMGILCMFGICLYGPTLGVLIQFYQETFFSTFLKTSSGIVGSLQKQGSPVFLAKQFAEKYEAGDYKMQLVVLLLVTVGLGAAAYFAYTRRRSERTGRALMYTWSEPVIRFMMAIPAGLGVGLFGGVLLAYNSNHKLIWWGFGVLFGTIMTHGILEVIYQMNFSKFFSKKLQLAAALVAVVLCILAFQNDITGYETYIPKYDDIEKISVGLEWGSASETFYDVNVAEDGYYVINDETEEELYELANSNVGKSQDIYDCLSEIVEGSEGIPTSSSQLPVRYTLKSGRTIYRCYNAKTEDIQKLVVACYEEGEIAKEKYSFLQIDNEYLKNVDGVFYDGNSYLIFPNDKEKKIELLNALKEDASEADASVYTGVPCAKLSFAYSDVPVKTTTNTNNLVPGKNSTTFKYLTVLIYPEFKRTVALLKETGYPMSMDELEVESVQVCYDGITQIEDLTYTDEEEIEALKKAMVPVSLLPSWMAFEDNIEMVIMYLKDSGEDGGEYVRLLAAEVPEFVKEDLQKATAK